MSNKIKKTTLAESPDAKNLLSDIQPNEVSLVDMPANGEPFVVVKGMDGNNMPTKVEKLDQSVVPRPVMKSIVDRLKGVNAMLTQVNEVSKSLPVSKEGETKNAPAPLVSLLKSTTAELRSLQSPTNVKVNKRASAESVLSVQALVKRSEDLAEIEKGNSVSYLMRDQYVSVTSSVSEWLTTYVDGVESDDDGPMLIPTNLDETVDKAAGELETLGDDYPAADEDDEPDAEGEVSKLLVEVNKLKDALHSATTEVVVDKKGSKMAADRLKSLKSVSSGVSEASDALSAIVKDLEDSNAEEEVDEMSTEKTVDETVAPVPTTKAVESVVETTATVPVQKNDDADVVTNEALMAALTKFATDTDSRFDKIEADVMKANEASAKATEEIEKIHVARGDSRGGETDETTKAVAKNADNASFHGLLGLAQ